MESYNVKKIGMMIFLVFLIIFSQISIVTQAANNFEKADKNQDDAIASSMGLTPPVITVPDEINIGEEVVIYFCSEYDDGSNDNIFYNIDWKIYPDFGQEFNPDQMFYGPYSPGETAYISYTFEIGGDYSIGVQAEDFDGVKSSVSYKQVIVNGGELDLQVTDTYTVPDKFIPNTPEVGLCSNFGNFGNKDLCRRGGYSLGHVYFDGNRLTPVRIVNGNFLLEVGEVKGFVSWSKDWPDDLEQHSIKFSWFGINGYLKKSAIENTPPEIPSKPQGLTNIKPGKEQFFSTSTTDEYEHKIYYMFDWGNGNFSDWLGPYKSGKTIRAKHSWDNEDSYEIRVKAKDEFGLETEWSEPLTVKVDGKSRSRQPILYNLFSYLFEKFPLLNQLLKIL